VLRDDGVTAKVPLWYDGGLGRRAPRGGDRGQTGGPYVALPAVVRRGQRATCGAGKTSRRRGARVGLGKARPWTARERGAQAWRRVGPRRRGAAWCGLNLFQPRRLRAHFSLKN
jgi:hypothetical protein